MFTDWTMTQGHYFYARGVIFGFIAATLLWVVVIPWVRKKLSKGGQP